MGSVVLLTGLALGVDHKLMSDYEYYGTLVNQFEFVPPAHIDFDDDGVPGTVDVEHDLHAVLRENGRELLRIPYDRIDDSLSTHIAWRAGGEGGRFVVFDAMGGGSQQVRSAYSLRDDRFELSPLTKGDEELLDAMASRDYTGTAGYWSRYRVVRLPLLALACLVTFGLAISSVLRRRSPAPPAELAHAAERAQRDRSVSP